MKKEAKDVGHEVLPDSGGAEATTGACEYPLRVHQSGLSVGSFSRLTNRSGATHCNNDITAVTLSAKIIYRALRRLRRGERKSASDQYLIGAFRTVACEQNIPPEVASAIPNLGTGTNDIY